MRSLKRLIWGLFAVVAELSGIIFGLYLATTHKGLLVVPVVFMAAWFFYLGIKKSCEVK
jgi:hypothetical protein